jgi:hypothetical protein
VEDRRRGAEQGVRFPVRFNDAWWRRDLIGSDPEGRAAARRARERWEREGVAPDELHACLAAGPDGTRLGNCVKAYLGAPQARRAYGIVFVADLVDGTIVLRHLAFGERHPTRSKESVYAIADRRLNR